MEVIVEFRILGPVEVHGSGGLVQLRATKQVTLMSALLLSANRIVSMDQLTEAIWDERPPVNSAADLHTHVYRLRRSLDAVEPGAQARVITYQSGYELKVEPSESDLMMFRREVERGRAAAEAGTPDQAAAILRAALDLWRGPALAGVPGSFAGRIGAALREEQRDALEELIEAELAMGKGGELVPELRKLIEADPLVERPYRQLMVALYRSGRRTEALEVFQTVRRRLVEELGIEPGSDVQEAHRLILAASPLLTRAGAPSAGAPGAPGAVGARAPIPRQIPGDIASFTGRSPSLAELDAILVPHSTAAPSTRIMTITGTAGAGKTALAVRWTHRVLEEFPDGQLYANLRGFGATAPSRPAEVLAQFVRALGVPPERVPAEPDEQAALFRSLTSGKRILVVLDNAATVEQVRPLLPSSPTCAVVITSRDELRGLSATHDTRRIVLGALTSAESATLLAGALGTERVEAEPAAAALLGRLCANLPLALRIAAANLATRPDLTLAEAADGLAAGDRLDQLQISGDPASAVRSAFGYSYSQLDEAAQRLFRLLGLVPGPEFSAAAAAVLADIPVAEATKLLDRLASAHLVERHPGGFFQFHDLLREYARERARAQDREPDRRESTRRLFNWYLDTAYAATGLINPTTFRIVSIDPAQTPGPRLTFDTYEQALAWCERERANLTAVTACAFEQGLHRIAWQLAATMWHFFFLRKHLGDWAKTHEIGLAAARELDDRFGQAWMLNGLAGAMRELQRPAESADCCMQALVISVEIGERWCEAANRTNLGWAYQRLNRLNEAAECHRHALGIRREIGDRWGEATNLTLLALTEKTRGMPERALALAQQAVVIWRELDVRWGAGMNLDVIGAVFREMGQLDCAVEHYEQALTLRRDAGDAWGEAETHAALGDILVDLGRIQEAKEHWCDALARYERFGHPDIEKARARVCELSPVPSDP